jgi:hypothetical protein
MFIKIISLTPATTPAQYQVFAQAQQQLNCKQPATATRYVLMVAVAPLPAAAILIAEPTDLREVYSAKATMFIKIILLTPATIQAHSQVFAQIQQ